MRIEAERYCVRADYAHALTNACQRFVGALLVVEPDVFVCAVTRLTLDAPASETAAEQLMAWTVLHHTVLMGALAHHALFHRCFDRSSCTFTPQPLFNQPWSDDKRFAALIRWASDLARAFDSTHGWPPAVRAARLLQKKSKGTWYVGEVAQAVNVSVATLERGFRKIYDVTVQQYQSLVRLRAVAAALRADESTVEGVVLDVGYRSVKDVYLSFRRLTGLTVAMARRLTDSQFAALMEGPLGLPVPGCPRKGLPQSRGTGPAGLKTRPTFHLKAEATPLIDELRTPFRAAVRSRR